MYELKFKLPEDGGSWTIHPLSPMPKGVLLQKIEDILETWPDCEISVTPHKPE